MSTPNGVTVIRRDPVQLWTIAAHVIMTCVGISCVTGLAVAGKVDGATATVVIVSALGIVGPTVGRPAHTVAALITPPREETAP